MDDKTHLADVWKRYANGPMAEKLRIPTDRHEVKLPGAMRSLLNHAIHSDLRQREGVRLSGTRVVTALAWQPAQDLAIERDQQQQYWFSGHVNAVLSNDDAAIVGADTGGVWFVSHQQFRAVSLSNDWDDPDISALAYAPGSESAFFAGTSATGALYHIGRTMGAMLPSSTRIPLSFGSGSIHQILVLAALERIVLATGNGIWWSPIPRPATNTTQYSWSQASGLPAPAGGFSSVTEGANNSVVAAAWGADPTTRHYGIFHGKWDTIGLTLQRSAIGGLDETRMLRTSLDTCAANRNIMYAVAAAANNTILGVLRSDDSGATWSARTTPATPDPGNQGFYNNCIAASPVDPDAVMVGWRTEGPFYSTDGGNSWTHPQDRSNPSLHSDNHALTFARSPNGALFVGSDGGVAMSRDLGQSYTSKYNQELATLQFYDNAFDVSSRFPGLMAGGTQDNGNIYCNLRATRPSWKQLEGGDGGMNRFIDALGILLRFNNTLLVNDKEVGNRVRMAQWQPDASNPAEGYFTGLGTVVPVDGNADGLGWPILEVVRHPVWARTAMKMYAVAIEPAPNGAWGYSGRIFGFFAKDDGTGATFSLLKDIGEMASSIASFDGTRIHIGTAAGRLLALDPASGNVSDLTPPAYGSGAFVRIDAPAASRAFALHSSGRLLHFDGAGWADTAGTGLAKFIADPRPGSHRVFAADDAKVYISNDDGGSWADASQGLPARPHCRDLRIGANARGGHDLYLATYGRSVFVATIDYRLAPGPHIPPRIPEEVHKVFGAVPRDGPGYYFVNGQLVPVGPRGPIMDILSALAIADMADGMSWDLRQRMRHTAFSAINEIALQELGRDKGRG
jgi:hypothetical protein